MQPLLWCNNRNTRFVFRFLVQISAIKATFLQFSQSLHIGIVMVPQNGTVPFSLTFFVLYYLLIKVTNTAQWSSKYAPHITNGLMSSK